MYTALWRRLDTPGHDAARVSRTKAGWLLEGVAVFVHEGRSARLTYAVECAADWRTRCGEVSGWIGDNRVSVCVRREDDERWFLNQRVVDGLAGCLDLDFGFTPATNFLQLRRADLGVGQATKFSVAWMDVPDPALADLPQHYHRRSERTYWYESPQSHYAALLEITAPGFVKNYPGLWQCEISSGSPPPDNPRR